MPIVVTTPTGHVGSRVTDVLVQAGERPRVLVRNAGRLDAELRDLVEVAEGDQGDPEFVAAQTRDATALFWVDPPGADDDPLDAYARMTASVVHAAVTNEIPRIVFLSSVGAELRHGAGEIDGLAGTEVALDDAVIGYGGSVTHLRCGYFFTNLLMDLDALLTGPIRTAVPLDQTMPWVDPRDIGDVAAARLLSDAWSGRCVQAVHGPADLTYRDVATILSDALDRPLAVESINDDDVRGALAGLGMTPAQADAIVGMTAGLRGFTPEDRRTFLTTTPTTLGAWARAHLRPRLDAGG